MEKIKVKKINQRFLYALPFIVENTKLKVWKQVHNFLNSQSNEVISQYYDVINNEFKNLAQLYELTKKWLKPSKIK